MVKPYYSEGGITLYHGDVRDLLPVVRPSFNAVAADPPYGTTSLPWDRWPVGWPSLIAEHAPAACSMWCMGSFGMFLDRRDDFAAWKLSQEVIWEKHNGANFHRDRFRRVHEIAAHWYRGPWGEVYKKPPVTHDATKRTIRRKTRPTHFGRAGESAYASRDGGPRLMRSVLRVRSCHGHAKNETQKPVKLLLPLIEYFCPPDGTILVPFSGAGSELLAAREMGCKAIGFEVREAQCAATVARLAQGELFGKSGDAA